MVAWTIACAQAPKLIQYKKRGLYKNYISHAITTHKDLLKVDASPPALPPAECPRPGVVYMMHPHPTSSPAPISR